MKKTLTINLNNIVFHIDDDAYELLQSYLAEVGQHFKSEAEKADIMNDIEARIAELFDEKMDKTKNVVTIDDVGEIIERLGKPSQFVDDEDESEQQKQSKNDAQQQEETKYKGPKKFYRDVDSQLLSGVSSGLAAYLDWDPTLVRIIFVLLAFLTSGTFILIYLLMWIIVPKAQTTAQKLEMRGEAVNIETIKNKMNDAKEYLESEKFKSVATATGSRIWEVIRVILKVLMTVVIAVIGVIGVVAVASLIFGLIVFLLEPDAVTGIYPDFFNQFGDVTPDKIILLIISLLLIIGCPIFAMIYWAIGLISKDKRPRTNTPLWISLVLWLAGIFMLVSTGGETLKKLKNSNFFINGSSYGWNYDSDANRFEETREVPKFNAIDASGAFKIEIAQQDSQQLTVNTRNNYYLSNIKTEVENGVLKIYTVGNLRNPHIQIKIGVDSLTDIQARGASNLSFSTPFNVRKLNIELEGASKADLNINSARKLGFNLQGATKINLEGAADTLSILGEGATYIDAEQMKAKNVRIEMAGASKADVYASEKFDGKAFGVSKITCTGNPKERNKELSVGSVIEFEE